MWVQIFTIASRGVWCRHAIVSTEGYLLWILQTWVVLVDDLDPRWWVWKSRETFACVWRSGNVVHSTFSKQIYSSRRLLMNEIFIHSSGLTERSVLFAKLWGIRLIIKCHNYDMVFKISSVLRRKQLLIRVEEKETFWACSCFVGPSSSWWVVVSHCNNFHAVYSHFTAPLPLLLKCKCSFRLHWKSNHAIKHRIF